MRVLLNATANELEQLGGDFTLYRDYRRLPGDGVTYELIPPHRLRQAQSFLRKGFEKLCRTWEPTALRRRLFLASRFLYVPSEATTGIHLIFSHLLFPAATRAKVPIVWSSQGISPAAYYDRYNRGQWTIDDVAWMYRQLGRRSDALVISTRACARNVVALCPELQDKIHFVPGPVFGGAGSPSAKPSERDGITRLLFVGIDAERKGLPDVVEAYRAVRECFPSVRLDIISRPSADLQSKIAALEGAQLLLSSPSLDIKSLMDQADIFVLPTRADTYALAAVEAMAHGCAVIISDLEPLPEVAPDGETGFVVPVSDPRAIAASLKKLLSDRELLRSFQENSRRRYSRLHAPDVVAAQLQQIFEQVLRRRSAPKFRGERTAAGIEEAKNHSPSHMTQIPPARRKVLVLTPSRAGVGGVQNYSSVLLEALREVLGADRVRCVEVPEVAASRADGSSSLRASAKIHFGIAAFLAAFAWRPDFIICTHVGVAPVSRYCQRLLRIPYWVVIHGIEVWGELSPAKLDALNAASHIIANSRFTLDITRSRHKLAPLTASILYPTLPKLPLSSATAHTDSAERSRPIVLTVGRMASTERYKGHEVVLEAWPLVLQRVRDAEYWLVGDGDDRQRLESRAGELGIAASSRFLGTLTSDKLAVCYDRCWVFAMPARTELDGPVPRGEGFGIVYLEAMAFGKPVVGPQLGAPAEFIRSGEHGLLVNPDDPAAVAGAIVELLSDRARAFEMGSTAKQWVNSEFSFESFCARLREALAK
jgi:phosphatidylinositol alpha-1,6-mannosyltransferase